MRKSNVSTWTAILLCTLLGWMAPIPISNGATKKAKKATGKVTLRLHPKMSLALRASWSNITAASLRFRTLPIYRHYHYKVAVPHKQYKASDFAPFLPHCDVQVGDIWKIPVAKVAHLFKQFHPNVRVKLHNGGPNGAYGMLRALSARYAEITFRIHIEFELKHRIYFTPAQMTGRLLLDRATQQLVYAKLYLPTHRIRNVDVNAEHQIDAVFVKTMQLIGGNPKLPSSITWEQQQPWKPAFLALAQKFYGFMKIRWRSVADAIKESRRTQKPIHLFIVYGSLDDQSC